MRAAIRLAKAPFSEKMIDDMAHIADAVLYLNAGQHDELHSGWKITSQELGE